MLYAIKHIYTALVLSSQFWLSQLWPSWWFEYLSSNIKSIQLEEYKSWMIKSLSFLRTSGWRRFLQFCAVRPWNANLLQVWYAFLSNFNVAELFRNHGIPTTEDALKYWLRAFTAYCTFPSIEIVRLRVNLLKAYMACLLKKNCWRRYCTQGQVSNLVSIYDRIHKPKAWVQINIRLVKFTCKLRCKKQEQADF